jgi:bifunctional ADP-heptose synthase (sugar kinase/adenylyltransferase)
VVFEEPTAERLLSAVRPEVYVKGADYASKTLPERPVVEAYGGQVVLVALEAGHSTTDLVMEIVRRFGAASTDDAS